MGKRTNILVLFVIVLSIPAFPQSQMGSATVPTTHSQNGLFRSSNQIDNSGNRIITGNVGGGRYFRGSVPYESTLDFGDKTSSSSLNSFRRWSSTSSNIYNTYTGKETPYYSYWAKPNQSTTNRSSIYQSRNYKINDKLDTTMPSSIYQDNARYNSKNALQHTYGYNSRYSEITMMPMTYNQQQGQKYTAPNFSKYSRGGQKLTSEQKQLLQEIVKVNPGRIDDKASDLRVKKQDTDESSKSYKGQKPFEQLSEQINTQTSLYLNKTDGQENSYDRMTSQLSLLQKQLEQLQKEQPQTKEKDEAQNLQKPALQKSLSFNNKNETAYTKQYIRTTEPNGDFNSFLGNKFRENLGKADNLLKNAKYYRAANTYTTAAVYNPRSASALAGKAHALFGAGEYLSSSLFLARALQMNPDYVRGEINIVAKMGGRDIIETRIAEIEEWIKKNDNPDLHFLVAYFYYRLDRLHKAQEHINAAKEKLPDVTVYDILKKIIDEAVATR